MNADSVLCDSHSSPELTNKESTIASSKAGHPDHDLGVRRAGRERPYRART